MKNKILLLFVCLALISGCSYIGSGSLTDTSYLNREFGIDKKKFTVIEEQDTHGGFHGDGTYHIALNCSDNKEKIYETISDWSQLPLSENLQLMMYGGERDGMTYGYCMARENNIPEINNGYYYFLDRHSESTDKYSDKDLFDRYSFNFSFAIYDADTDILYYIREDT